MSPKSLAERKKRMASLMRILRKLFPTSGTHLHFKNRWELLVAVQLSAQCTDKQVNKVTATLFKKYPTLDSYIHADRREFEKDIHSTGFFRNKTRNILAAAKMVQEIFHGRVPGTLGELISIPGVGRKTANVVLGNGFGIAEGIAVDTHVRRFAIKFNLSDATDPKRIEQDLMKLISQKDWFWATYAMIQYGREICPGRVHDCSNHPGNKAYPQAEHRFPRAR